MFKAASSDSLGMSTRHFNGVDSAGQGRYRGVMTDVASSQSYGVVYAPPPVGQPMHGSAAPGYPGVPPPPRGPRNLLGIVGGIAGCLGLVLGVIALIVSLATRPSVSGPPPTAPQPPKPFMISDTTDKQWCAAMRPLLQENLEMTPSTVVDGGPDGAEYAKYSAWVRGWADRMTSSMNGLAESSGSGWLDRTGRRLVDLTISVSFVNHDQWFKTDAAPIFNEAAVVTTSIRSYCRSVGEPVTQ